MEINSNDVEYELVDESVEINDDANDQTDDNDSGDQTSNTDTTNNEPDPQPKKEVGSGAQKRIDQLTYNWRNTEREFKEYKTQTQEALNQMLDLMTSQEKEKAEAKMREAVDSGDSEAALEIYKKAMDARDTKPTVTPQSTTAQEPPANSNDALFKARYPWYGVDQIKTAAALQASNEVVSAMQSGTKTFNTQEEMFDEIAQVAFSKLNKTSNAVKPKTPNAGVGRPTNMSKPPKAKIVIKKDDPELKKWINIMGSEEAAVKFVARKRAKEKANG